MLVFHKESNMSGSTKETELETEKPSAEFARAVRDIIPLAAGVAVYGLAFGLLAAQAMMAELEVGIMGAIVFAGSSQIIAVERIMAGAGAGAALLAGIALNLRLVLITASLRQELAGRAWWQIALGVHLASDENWALMHATRSKGMRAGYWYLIGGGAMLMVVWVSTTTIGVSVAGLIPEPRALGMDFAFTAAFIAILCSLFRGKSDIAPWLIAIGSTVLLIHLTGIDPSWALAISGVIGSASAGLLSQTPDSP